MSEISPSDILNEAELNELAFQCFRREVEQIRDDLTELIFRARYYQDELTQENLEKIATRLSRALVDFP